MNNAELLEELLTLLPKLYSGFSRPILDIAKETVSGLQLRILSILRSHSSISMTKTAMELHVSKQQLTVAMDKLVNIGFVTRTTDKADRRKITLCLTEEAEAFFRELFGAISALYQDRLNCLSEEEKILFFEACHDIITIMDKMERRDTSSTLYPIS